LEEERTPTDPDKHLNRYHILIRKMLFQLLCCVMLELDKIIQLWLFGRCG